MHYFCQNLSIFKGCIASSMKKSSIERARACSKMKIRASSMLDHQKLASDGHFSGSSMLGCNTTGHPVFALTFTIGSPLFDMYWKRRERKSRQTIFCGIKCILPNREDAQEVRTNKHYCPFAALHSCNQGRSTHLKL